VTGGSQGAHRVNEIASKALVLLNKELSKVGRKLHVIHQTGVKDAEWVAKAYAEADIPARVNAFEHEMGRAMSTAHVVVARAGASTCFELALTGRPAFLIPLPSAMRNHQHYNAAAFASKLAAAEGVQEDLTPGALAKWLFHKTVHIGSLLEMAGNMKSMAVPDAAGRVADLVERIAGDK
jgi:UDP-N-acetylglucosamine--N-acetylmuramyl-(pentapeptide) pyrophosphoryl-undecaprenol N-acetylglucosamine transferase